MLNHAPGDNLSSDLAELHECVRACRACELAGLLGQARPIREAGLITSRVMLIGQAPGARSDAARQHFIGPAGDLLERWFEQAGFTKGYFRREVYLTAMTRCYPGKQVGGKGDRVPSRAELALCRPFLERELELVRPRLVLLVGSLAIAAFVGRQPLIDLVGTLIEHDGRRYLPLPHTSPVSRWLNDPRNQRRVDRAIELLAECRLRYGLDRSRLPVDDRQF